MCCEGTRFLVGLRLNNKYLGKIKRILRCAPTLRSQNFSIFDDANIAIEKEKIIYPVAISFFVAKSISFYKSNLLTLASVESIAFKVIIILLLISLSTYRFLSSLSFIYKLYKKSYFTIAGLYMRYISLSKPLFTITRILLSKSQVQSKIIRIIIIFLIILI